jgi:hypothetical protein
MAMFCVILNLWLHFTKLPNFERILIFLETQVSLYECCFFVVIEWAPIQEFTFVVSGLKIILCNGDVLRDFEFTATFH